MIRRTIEAFFRTELPKDLAGWENILRANRTRWDAARANANGPGVLLATSTGGNSAAVLVESVLAVALTLRGARVHLLLCDSALPACQLAHVHRYRDEAHFVREGPAGKLCRACMAQGFGTYEPLGLPLHRYGDLLSARDKDAARRDAAGVDLSDVASYRWNGLAIGEHAYAAALRFVTRGDFAGTEQAGGILRRYVEAGLLTARVTGSLIDEHKLEHACFHHGIYVPQGVIGEVARQRGLHVVNWQTSYRAQCFTFSHERSYHFTMLDEPESNWANLEWTEEREQEIVTYIDSRRHGTRDWISYHDHPVEDLAEIAAETGIDFSRPCVAMLTNVVWDAVLFYRDNAFRDSIAWTLETIRYFAERHELQLVIRVHPAEIRGTLRSRQPIIDEIRKAFPELPPNVFVIPPESRIGTYALAAACDAAIIYATKMGIELATMGIPVVVAGEAWIRNKGFTRDATSAGHYFELLDQLPLGRRMPPEEIRRARMYAYHFFFRRMIPWSFMEATGAAPPFRLAVASVDDLAPGRDLGLDVVCDGILNGSEFIYPAERTAVPTDAALAVVQ